MTADEIRKTLIARLKELYDNRDFIVGVISNATHPDDRKSIIEYIDNGEGVTMENILLLSVYLDQKRYG